MENFGHGRPIGQNDHCFRSYMTQKTLKNLYKFPLWLFFMKQKSGKMIAMIVN